MASNSVNGVVVLAYRVSGAKAAAKNAEQVASGVKKSGAEAAEATTGFERFAGGIDKAVKRSTSWIHAAKGLAGAWLGVSAAFEVKDFLKDSAKEALSNQTAMQTFTVALRNTTHATNEQVDASGEWIDKMATTKGFLKNDLLKGYQQLAQATGSTSKAQKLLGRAMDAARGTGKPLTSVTMALARAYNGSVTSLSRLGIKTTQYVKNTVGVQKAHLALALAQKTYDTALAKSGKTSATTVIAAKKLALAHEALTKAQTTASKKTLSFNQVVGQMGKTFKGQASQYSKTFPGEMAALSESFNELKIKIGNGLLPLLAMFANFMLHKVVPAIEAQVDKFEHFEGTAGKVHKALNTVYGIAKSVFGFLAAHKSTMKTLAISAVALYVAINVLAKVLAVSRAIWAGYNTVLTFSKVLLGEYRVQQTLAAMEGKSLSIVTFAMTKAQWALNAAWEANPIGLVLVGLVALAALFVLAYKKVGWFRSGVNATFSWIKKHWPLLLAILTGPIGLAVLVIAKHWSRIKAGASSAVHWITSKWNGVISFFKSAPRKMSKAAAGMFDGIKDAFKSAIDWVISKWNNLSFSVPSVNTHIKGIGKIGGFTLGTPNIPMLAKGGDLRAGQAAIVGDGGVPELFVPRTAGHVYPSVSSGAIAAGLASNDGGSGGALLVHAHIDLDGESVFDGILGAAQKQGAFE